VSWWFKSFGCNSLPDRLPGQNGECPRPNDQSMTKPETPAQAALGDIRRSSFGLDWSLVLRHWTFCRCKAKSFLSSSCGQGGSHRDEQRPVNGDVMGSAERLVWFEDRGAGGLAIKPGGWTADTEDERPVPRCPGAFTLPDGRRGRRALPTPARRPARRAGRWRTGVTRVPLRGGAERAGRTIFRASYI